MTVRPTLHSDLDDSSPAWLVPAADLEQGVSLVEEVDGRVVAAGVRRFTRTGASRDGVELHCHDGHGSILLRQLADAAESPVLVRVIPGTPMEVAATEAGGRVVQSVPAAYVDTSHPDVREWADRHASLDGGVVTSGEDLTLDELVDLWMAPYLRMHEGWAPTEDVAATRASFRRRFAEALDTGRTSIARVDGAPLAAVFVVGPFDGILMPILIEVEPDHPMAESAARAAVARALASADPHPVEFDGHADEPTYLRILLDIPQRSSGALTPVDLIELD
ncbi:hypothetical protein ACQBAT_03170 [Ornithinimicrobium sp. Y1847]|uniref:hypothetical protein n=1 Tax=Ornithinimicrobium sp. Y1847 TaxID=3405419 RepID=UPI003B679951